MIFTTPSTPGQPLVSVAMITFNHRPYLEQAVNCVLKQEVDFGIEVIIGEDQSTDGTRQIALDFQSRYPERIRTIVSDANVGMHRNLLRTEQTCRGKYVAYCEGDDFWHDPTKLAKQVALLEGKPDYVMAHSHCDRHLVANGRLLPDNLRVPRNLDPANAYSDILLGRRSPLTVTVMARREALDRVLESCPECTDPRRPMADTQRWLELSRLGKVGCVHESLATTNVLPESAGQSRDPRKRLRFYLAVRELKLHYLKKYPIAPEMDRQVREKLALILLQRACDARDVAVANALYQDYVKARGRGSLRARWLRWGARSALNAQFIAPLVRVEAKWRNLRHRFAS